MIAHAKSHNGESTQQRGHKPRLLTAREEQKIYNALDNNGSLTNRQLAALVSNKIAPRTITDVLARAKPPFSRQRYLDQEPEEFTEEWKQEVKIFIQNTLRHIALKDRIYGDESALYTNEAPTYGRGRQGTKLLRSCSAYGKKFVLHTYISQERVVYWELNTVNANDEEIRRISVNVLKNVNDEKYLIWDRLGRSGRCKNPTAQHYNPEVKSNFKQAGLTVLLLPPKGKYLNPAELLFNDLKEHFVRPAFVGNGEQFTFDKLARLIRKYMNTITSDKLKSFFYKRANGKEVYELGLLND